MVKKTEDKGNEEKNRKDEKNIEELFGISKDEIKAIKEQVDKEYRVAWELTEPKRKESLARLKLYNNQKRDKSRVGDPLLFTVFNTVLAAVYEDALSVSYQAKEQGDDEVAENLDAVALHDYMLMGKDKLDYDWDWDAAFFGRGFVLLNDFDRSEGVMCPVAEVIDPMLMLRDPDATSVNGDQQGKGSARFWGREISLMKFQMEDHPSYHNIKDLRRDKDLENLTDRAAEARDSAQGRQNNRFNREDLTENYNYNLLEWWTHYKGKKVLITLAEGRNRLVRFQYLKDNNDKAATQWPLIDRVIYPMAHDWDGVSIPDLIEDKQRAKSVMINLGMDSSIADLYPMYLFNNRKIKNTKDLKFGFNKFIPVTGDVNNAMQPVQKSLFHNQVNVILDILNTAAEKAVAAPEVAQGVQPKKDRTLGETELVISGSRNRQSLSAKIFGWSEKRFWQQHYYIYKGNFVEELDEKIIRIKGVLSLGQRVLTRQNIVARIDPDIIIESKNTVLIERRQKFQEFSTFAQVVVQDPTTNRRYVNRRLGRLIGLRTDELNLIFPPTIDELEARDENVLIGDNKLPKVSPLENDIVHIEIHNKATDKKAKYAHIEAHKMMMKAKRERPETFQTAETQDTQQAVTPISSPTQPANRPVPVGRGNTPAVAEA